MSVAKERGLLGGFEERINWADRRPGKGMGGNIWRMIYTNWKTRGCWVVFNHKKRIKDECIDLYHSGGFVFECEKKGEFWRSAAKGTKGIFCVLVVLDALLTLLDARDHILMNAPSLLFAYTEAKPRMLQKHQEIVDDGCVSHEWWDLNNKNHRKKNHVTSEDQLGKIIFIWNTSPKLGDSTNVGNRKGPGDVYEKKSHQNWLIAPELVDVFFFEIWNI